jgi:hypothetical protein
MTNFEVNLTKPYDRGSRNYFYKGEQIIRISEGCPNSCEYCRETLECGREPIYFDIPDITCNRVKILDMNLIYKSKALEIIKELGLRKFNNHVVYYELVCGIDYRYMTLELAQALKESRFINIRFAWDYGLNLQYKIKDCVNMLLKVGYRPKELMCFMVCNWKIPFIDRCRQLDLLKVWNILVSDCWFDNQLSPNIKPIGWNEEEIKSFRKMCRKHNQLILFGIDPELKKES